MASRTRSILLVGVAFALYRTAATFLYNSGMGVYDTSFGFVSNLGFVLVMNAVACVTAVLMLQLLHLGRLPRVFLSPWPPFASLTVGVLVGMAPNMLPHGVTILVTGGACGFSLTLLCALWLDVFARQDDASLALTQIVTGYSLYTALSCLFPLMGGAVGAVISLAMLAISSELVGLIRRRTGTGRSRQTWFRRGTHLARYPELPLYVCFFVLTGVVGIMHTSVLGSPSESLVSDVPMWATRVASLVLFLTVVVFMGQSFSPTAVFKVFFSVLIGVLTLLPFLGQTFEPLTGLLSIVCYSTCGMVFYLFMVRETRRLDLSSVLMAGVYTLGASGALLIGLGIGIVLQTISAGMGFSLLTLLAFAAIYPLVAVLGVLLRQDTMGSESTKVSVTPPEPVQGVVASTDYVGRESTDDVDVESDLRPFQRRAVVGISDAYGLTRREREVLGYLVAGRSVRYIAETLVISENTAWTHVKRIYAKTGTHGKQDVIRLAEEWT